MSYHIVSVLKSLNLDQDVHTIPDICIKLITIAIIEIILKALIKLGYPHPTLVLALTLD